jgi:SAM-dependent methyltransferase
MVNKEYWEARYANQEIGWDVGEITTPLKIYIDQLSDNNLKVLIPGAGNSYELDYFLNNKFTNVSVLDFAEKPLQNIKKRVTNVNPNQLILSDFFEHEAHYDLVIEQTFFCALDPELRKKYATKMYSLLKPKGKLVGLLFDFPLTEVGPPFGGSIEEYRTLFSPYFHIKILEKSYNSIKPRDGKELFVIFEKK